MAENLKDDSSDNKTIVKRPLVLYDLPVQVLGIVAGKLPLLDCLSLRKVSRDLRDLVDSSELHCQDIEFAFGYNCRTMSLNNLELSYEQAVDGGCKISSNRKDTRKKNTYRDDRNFEQVMSADATTFLGNPKLEIGRMRFQVYWKDDAHEFAQFLTSINLQLNVKSIRGGYLKLLHSIQEHLNPDKLEEILYSNLVCASEFIELAETNPETVKNPKLKLEIMYFDGYSDESSAKFSEILKSINSQLNIRSIHVGDRRWILTVLHSLNSEKVEDFIIEAELTAEEFNAIAGKKQWKTKTRLLRDLPEWVGLEDLVDFTEIRNKNFELTEENLIKIRDILLKSSHLNLLELRNSNPIENMEEQKREMNETIDRIMSESPEYDSSTRRFSIPNSSDIFQLKLGEQWDRTMFLTIERISPL